MNDMYPLDLLALARTRARELHAEAPPRRPRRGPGARRALAGALRRAADRLDPASLGAEYVITRCR